MDVFNHFLFASYILHIEGKSFIQHSVFQNKICRLHNKNCTLQVFSFADLYNATTITVVL